MPNLSTKPATLSEDSYFLDLLPRIRRHLLRALTGLRSESRDDALCECVANCFVAFTRLRERGRLQMALPGSLAKFAVAQLFAGRRVGNRMNSKDVLSPIARRQRHLQIQAFSDERERCLESMLADRRTSVPDLAAFRIDFSDWLRQLTPNKRHIALALARGDAPSDVSVRFRLSRSRISQLRGELKTSWQLFHGEDLTDFVHH